MSESSELHHGNPSGWKPGLGAGASPASSHSLIGPTVVIKGEVLAEEDLLVMGRIEGHIDHSSTVTVHADGVIAAEVKAQEVLVEGRVDGNVYGTRRVQIAETGTVNGNVYAPRVGVLEGASFKGAIDMESDVSVIERRFHEKTGTEARAQKSKEAGKPADKELKGQVAEGEKDAAQAEKEGTDDVTAAAAADGTDSRHG